MADFNEAFEKTLKHEGAYSNNAKDKGGETYKGIARNFWPDWGGWKIIDRIKNDFPPNLRDAQFILNPHLHGLVCDFYKVNFWDKLNCVYMPQPIANELFDTSVNMGIGYGGKCLQQALNKLNRNQQDYPDLIVDGGIGNKSIDALTAYYATSRYASRNEDKLTMWLLKWMNFYQLKKYDEITNRDLEQEIFIPGWTERT